MLYYYCFGETGIKSPRFCMTPLKSTAASSTVRDHSQAIYHSPRSLFPPWLLLFSGLAIQQFIVEGVVLAILVCHYVSRKHCEMVSGRRKESAPLAISLSKAVLESKVTSISQTV
jgi:hypothetical protein